MFRACRLSIFSFSKFSISCYLYAILPFKKYDKINSVRCSEDTFRSYSLNIWISYKCSISCWLYIIFPFKKMKKSMQEGVQKIQSYHPVSTYAVYLISPLDADSTSYYYLKYYKINAGTCSEYALRVSNPNIYSFSCYSPLLWLYIILP